MDEQQAQDWRHVWDVVEVRRIELGWSLTRLYEETKVSEATFRKMHDGVPIKRLDKRRSLVDALGWEGDAVDLILVGKEPKVAQPEDSLAAKVERLEREMQDIKRMITQLGKRPPPGTTR